MELRAVAGFTTCLCLHVHSPSLNRKWQEANQKVQELQASQEVRADQEQRIKVSGSVSGGLHAGSAPCDPWGVLTGIRGS